MSSRLDDVDGVHRDCRTHINYRPRGRLTAGQRVEERKRDKRRAVVNRVAERYLSADLTKATTPEEAANIIYGSAIIWGLWAFLYRDLIWQAIKYLVNRWYDRK